MKVKKIVTKTLFGFAVVGATIAPVMASTSVGGGTWDYGVNDKIVWSQYNHNSKTHKSSVLGFVANDSGWKTKTVSAYSDAPKSAFTNQSFWDVK